jgi:hypothetical protein
MYWPFAADFFKLTPLRVVDWSAVVLIVALTYAACLVADRALAGGQDSGPVGESSGNNRA